MAGDKSSIIRKKVIQILGLLMEKFSRDEVMKVLIVQWQDTSPQVRINVIKCLGKILRKKTTKNVSEALKFLHGLICSLPMSSPYKFI